MRLWIIGNGFDLYHGLRTKYLDYKAYLCEDCNKHKNNRCPIATGEACKWCCRCEVTKNPKCLVRKFNALPRRKAWTSEGLWSDLEEACSIDFDRLMKKGKGTYVRADDTKSDMPLVGNEYDALGFAPFFTGDRYYDWLRKVETNMPKAKEDFRGAYLDVNIERDFFVTFNYTSTIQVFYGSHKVVDEGRICYIHGSVKEASGIYARLHQEGETEKGKELHEKLVFGSSDVTDAALVDAVTRYKEKEGDITEDDSERLIQHGKKLIRSLNKDVEQGLKRFRGFIQDRRSDIKDLDEIIVAGHSLCRIDAPYFEEFVREFVEKKWCFLCHGKRDAEKALRFCADHKLESVCVPWGHMARNPSKISECIKSPVVAIRWPFNKKDDK